MDEQDPEPQKQPDMFAGASPPDASEPAVKRGGGHARSLRALERLKDRISLVSRELQRLREENATLQREVEQLQMHGLGAVDGTPIAFSENPAELRAQVEGFIDSIDAYLDEAQSSSKPS